MVPKRLSPLFRLFDALLTPAMYMCAGTLQEKPQETHIWHIEQFDSKHLALFPPEYFITLQGTDNSRAEQGRVFGLIPEILFHMPLLGGWSEFVVLKACTSMSWHIGWYIPASNSDMPNPQIHKLPLHTSEQIRLLTGPKERTVTFFAVAQDGTPVPLTRIGTGKIGNAGQYSSIRLF